MTDITEIINPGITGCITLLIITYQSSIIEYFMIIINNNLISQISN